MKCPKGTYTPKEGMTRCIDCISGSYNDAEGMQECKECPAGFISDGGKFIAKCLIFI